MKKAFTDVISGNPWMMKPCMPGRNISILLNLIYFKNLFRDIGFSSSYCFVPVYQSLDDQVTFKRYGLFRRFFQNMWSKFKFAFYDVIAHCQNVPVTFVQSKNAYVNP